MSRRLALVTLLLIVSPAVGEDPPRRTENVVIVTLDGFRWQELFGGADVSFIEEKLGGVKNVAATKKKYWRESAEERRKTLLPFFWETIATRGQVFGDAKRQAASRSTNGRKFSYPGYSELFCGFVDPRIDSNGKKNNPNLSVLEFLNAKPAFQNRVAACCTWDVFPFIFRSSTNGMRVQAGWSPIPGPDLHERERAINDTMALLPRYWADNVFDSITMQSAKELIARHKPRVLYIALGETDEWGHGRRYDLYLDSAHNSDRFIGDLWSSMQQMPQYRDRTTLIVTTDHGRGLTREDWTDHGEKVSGAEFVWIAVMGPDTPALGVREKLETTQSQVAATIAQAVGEDFLAVSSKSAPPLAGVFR